jgi:hypothetical protein
MLDDTIKNKKGRPKKLNNEVHRSLYVDPDIWEAAGDLPVPRPDILREALINAISFYTSDLPKLRWQLSEIQAQKQTLEAKELAIIKRIEELEANVLLQEEQKIKSEESKVLAAKELVRLSSIFKREMTHEHFSIISNLSGLDAAMIAVFCEDTKFRPTYEEALAFTRG